MSYVTIQIGQCGNQLGPCFYDVLASEYARYGRRFYDELDWNPFFRLASSKDTDQRPVARSVLIDMEPSVVESAFVSSLEKRSNWVYSRSNLYVQTSGSGNNWATGCLHYGPLINDSVTELARRELERADVFGSFLLMNSVAGGTGSGLGAFLTGSLHDAFPKTCIMNYSIWPFKAGEVIVQGYNALLSLSHIMESSHAIFVTDNDDLSDQLAGTAKKKQTSFEDMNRCAMYGLTSFLLPSKMRPIAGQIANGQVPGSWMRIISDGLSCLCPTRFQKLLSCRNIPQLPLKSIDYATFSWNALLKRTHTLLRDKRRSGEAYALFLTLRGRHALQPDVRELARSECYTNRVPRLAVAYSPVSFGRGEMAVSLVSNARSNITPVQITLRHAKQLFKSKAFLHSYSSYGLDQNDFKNAFAYIEDNVISAYTA